jgi:hypothetical protein
MDTATLLAPRADTASGMPEDDVELPGGIGTVRVRGLSRWEVLAARATATDADREVAILKFAMVDPTMTEEQAAEWMKLAPAGELEPVTDKIGQLSGLAPGAAKEAVKEFVSNPDAEFRALPSPETRDDGGAHAGGDAER